MIETEAPNLAATAGPPPCPMPAVAHAARTPAGRDEGYELVIRPGTGWVGIDWKELFANRELLFFLVRRDILVRYKQTVLGPAWAILQPLIMMAIFTLIFGRFGKIEPPGGGPYPVFVFAALIPWTLFSQGLSQSALSLVAQQNLLTKVYFPRLYVPIAAASVFLVDVALSSGLYALLLAYYRVTPSWTVVFLPALIALTLVGTLGLGLLIAALTVFYRDFRHIVPFLVQILMFMTPVIYPIEYVGHRTRLVMALNPMFGIIAACRAAILGTGWDPACLAISAASALSLFTFALFYFRRTERRFADFA